MEIGGNFFQNHSPTVPVGHTRFVGFDLGTKYIDFSWTHMGISWYFAKLQSTSPKLD